MKGCANNEITVSITDDESPTGRSNIFVLKTKTNLKEIKVNYSQEDIDALSMLAVDSNSQPVKILADDSGVE